MVGDAKSLKWSLKNFGLSDSVIKAAWPDWWTDGAEASQSSRAELRFSIARKLGLDPRTLLDDSPRFVWRDEAKFKRFTGEEDFVRAALSSFGISIAKPLIAATPPGPELVGVPASELRRLILSQGPYVRFADLLTVCWAIGVPIIHPRLLPLSAKRMCAMTVRVGDRFAILIGQDSIYPAVSAFHLAHEIGHIALGHVSQAIALVDFHDPLERASEGDGEEASADAYALELLTGSPDTVITTETQRYTAPQLAKVALDSSAQLQIDPGTIALCFGYSTGRWPTTFAALKRIYPNPEPVWSEVNALASEQLNWEAVPHDFAHFIHALIKG